MGAGFAGLLLGMWAGADMEPYIGPFTPSKDNTLQRVSVEVPCQSGLGVNHLSPQALNSKP